MKRNELIKILEKQNYKLKRHGANHDIYENLQNNKIAPVPRHKEIPDSLCKLIFKQLKLIIE